MGSSAIDGLISGLDTTTMINQLMNVEAAPQTALKARVSTTNAFVSALQSLNIKLASLTAAGTKAATSTSWDAATASSSAPSVIATTSAGAQVSSFTFAVAAVAKPQTSVSAATTDLAALFGGTVPASLTISTGTNTGATDATVKPVSLAGVTDLAGLAAAINDSGSGVSATVVQVDATRSRLQLTSKATGATSAFDLYSGTVTAAQISSGTAPSAVMGRTGSTAIALASDASITLWKGSAAEQIVTSSNNTFTGLVTGVDFTVSVVETNPITVSIAQDEPSVTALASGLVTNIATVLLELESQTKYTSATDSSGRTTVKGGVLSGDSAVRAMKQMIISATSDPVNGISPSTIGIVLGKDGAVSFDAKVFAAALANDPDKVQDVVSGLAARVQAVGDGFSNASTGSISQKVTGQQIYVKALGDQVLGWDDRLSMRRAALEKTYSALEVALGNLKSQSDWLTSQLATLTPSSS